jgi:hypothetical protein
MPDKEDKHRAHVYFGPVITPIIEGYARAQGVTFGTVVRRLMCHVLHSEITNSGNAGYKPRERRKDWK